MLKTRLVLGLVSVGLAAASCGSDNQVPQPPNVQPAQLPNVQPAQPRNVQPAQPPSNAKPAQPRGYQSPVGSNQPAPPKDAQYTIYAFKVNSANHVEMAEKIRRDLTAQTEFKDWHVIHQASESLLYYGYYKSIDPERDKKEAARALDDRNKIASMTDQLGNRPFARAMIVELSAPDPNAPPEWNLINAPGDLTLQIGTYKDSAQRKEAAVEAVREARKNGLEAYYYHGPTLSMVCIGHWPASAIREEMDKPINPTQEYMVASDSNDPRVIQQMEEMAARKGVPLVRKRKVVTDPTLEAMMRTYPYNAINGEFVKRKDESGAVSTISSQVLPIPHDATAASGASPGTSSVQSAYDRLFQAQQRPDQNSTATQQPSNAGQLRGIGN